MSLFSTKNLTTLSGLKSSKCFHILTKGKLHVKMCEVAGSRAFIAGGEYPIPPCWYLLAIVDSSSEHFSREFSKDDGVDGADARAAEHRCNRMKNDKINNLMIDF